VRRGGKQGWPDRKRGTEQPLWGPGVGNREGEAQPGLVGACLPLKPCAGGSAGGWEGPPHVGSPWLGCRILGGSYRSLLYAGKGGRERGEDNK
jgi:hypothetical protein